MVKTSLKSQELKIAQVYFFPERTYQWYVRLCSTGIFIPCTWGFANQASWQREQGTEEPQASSQLLCSEVMHGTSADWHWPNQVVCPSLRSTGQQDSIFIYKEF